MHHGGARSVDPAATAAPGRHAAHAEARGGDGPPAARGLLKSAVRRAPGRHILHIIVITMQYYAVLLSVLFFNQKYLGT